METPSQLTVVPWRRITASSETHGDLFWALRGGSGNFGVVTSFQYRLHPLGPEVMCLPLSTVNVWHQGGAISRIGSDESAFPHREAPYLLSVEANWKDPGSDQDNIAWARQTCRQMDPSSLGGSYVNFESFGGDETRAAYGDRYRRLAQVKAKYDPDNVFRVHHSYAKRRRPGRGAG